MAKKVCPPKKKPAKKGLAGASQCGGKPLEVSISRASLQLPLRDLFAAFALAGIISSCDCNTCEATEAYRFSDAMMKRRLVK